VLAKAVVGLRDKAANPTYENLVARVTRISLEKAVRPRKSLKARKKSNR
jgi:hypothetical protein